MLIKLKKYEIFVLPISFWTTAIITRAFLFFASVWRDRDPRIMLGHFRVHHYFLGLFLLLGVWASISVFHKRRELLQLIGIGIGAALLVDEISFLFLYTKVWSSGYWGVANFFSIIFFGLILTSFARSASGGRSDHRVSKVATFLPIFIVILILLSFFYDANYGISEAKEFHPAIIEHVKTVLPRF